MLFSSPALDDHEFVEHIWDAQTGLECIVAIHSTARGPGAGGCRMLPYESPTAALTDCLNLSRAMSHKCAIADLELGGAWSVIIADSGTRKSRELFEAYGRAVDGLAGRFWAIVDVGTTQEDMATARGNSHYVTGVPGHPASGGDPSKTTALGVFRSIELCASRHLERPLKKLRIAVQGTGQVGSALCHLLAGAGADLTISDIDPGRAEQVAAQTGARIVEPDRIVSEKVDIICPCALGNVVTPDTIKTLRTKVIVGGANNQVSDPALYQRLHDHGILYVPDYVANAGGIIAIASEIRATKRGESFDDVWVTKKIDRLIETLEEIFDRSAAEDRTPFDIADEIATQRLARPR
jgi:leucine dehydrogenase